MNKIEIIIEGNLSKNEEEYIQEFCTIKSKIGIIDMYIIEIEEEDIAKLEQFSGINSINMATMVITQ